MTQTFRDRDHRRNIGAVSASRFRPSARSNGGSARPPHRGRSGISRLVREDVLSDPDLLSALRRVADGLGQSMEQVSRRAERHLDEIAASPSRLMVVLAAGLGRLLYRRAYGAIHYNREGLEEALRLGAGAPIVFLPCHRSNLDRPIMHYLLWKNGHAPNYTAGGINMNFFPVGPISRRAGVFFIRRTFAANPVYKLVLQTYFSYLIEQRRPLEWYIEGGRSRTGKLRSPRYGLLGYAAAALMAGKSEDVYLIPTSINYDHVLEVDAYTAEQSGIAKEQETFGWMVKSIRSLPKRNGNVHVRFGEPLSMRGMIGPGSSDRDRRHDLRNMASEVCMRINRVTPITPTALVVTALLSDREQALTGRRLEATLAELVDHAESCGLPSTEPLSVLGSERVLRDVIRDLADRGIVTVDDRDAEPGGSEPAYRIEPGRRLAASYYRNTIVHFFVGPAVGELALAAAASEDTLDRPSERFRDHVETIRDLVAFEFFLPDPPSFIDDVTAELTRRHPGWQEMLEEGSGEAVLERLRPHRASWVLRSIFESYLVVAEQLAQRPVDQPWDRSPFSKACLERSKGYVQEGRIGAEAASLSLFANALRVAARRDLLGPGPDDLATRRNSFAAELRRILALVDSPDVRPPAATDTLSDPTRRIRP